MNLFANTNRNLALVNNCSQCWYKQYTKDIEPASTCLGSLPFWKTHTLFPKLNQIKPLNNNATYLLKYKVALHTFWNSD